MGSLLFLPYGLPIFNLLGTTTIAGLKYQGTTIDTPAGSRQKPDNPLTAGLLNLLPGVGNFYLGNGQAAQSEQNIYGLLNLLSWPFSILWGVPEAAIGANVINRRDMLMDYRNGANGKQALEEFG